MASRDFAVFVGFIDAFADGARTLARRSSAAWYEARVPPTSSTVWTPASMALYERVIALLEADTEEAFGEVVQLLRGAAPGPEQKAVLQSLRGELPEALVLKAIARSRVREAPADAYREGAAPPFDVRTRMVVQDLLAAAGHRKLEPAREILVELLRSPAVGTYAAHALASFGDARALDAFLEAMPELVSTSRSVAIRSVIAADRLAAPARLAPFFDDSAFVHALLYELFRDCKWSNDERRMVPVEGWIDEPRYVALAVHTLETSPDRELCAMVRDLLKAADPALVPKRRAKPRPKKTPKPARDELLARAREELSALPGELAAAVTKLRALGYRFVGEPLAPPPKGVKSRLTALEKEVGPLPATVRAFYELVGSVDLRGTHPDWPRTGSVVLAPEPHCETDPLVVLPLSCAFDALEDRDEEAPFLLPCIPEPLAKAGFSAGPGYAVRCGEPMAYDPPLVGDPANHTFLAHLRRALAWGGLPGLETIDDIPQELVRALR